MEIGKCKTPWERDSGSGGEKASREHWLQQRLQSVSWSMEHSAVESIVLEVVQGLVQALVQDQIEEMERGPKSHYSKSAWKEPENLGVVP